jgi:hypothetical protein
MNGTGENHSLEAKEWFPQPPFQESRKGKHAFGEAILFAAFLRRGPEKTVRIAETIPIHQNLLTEWVFHAIMRMKKSGFCPMVFRGTRAPGAPFFLKALPKEVRPMKKLVSLALVFALLLSLTGLAAAEDEKSVNIGVTGTLTTLNPMACDNTEIVKYAVSLVFLPLVELNAELEFVPLLAESITPKIT